METIDKENLWQGGFIWNWFPSKTKVEEIRPTIVDNVPALLGLSQAMAKKTPISLKQKGNFRIKIVESPLKSEISNTRAGEKNYHLLFLYAVVLAECHKITCSTNSLKHISTCGKFFFIFDIQLLWRARDLTCLAIFSITTRHLLIVICEPKWPGMNKILISSLFLAASILMTGTFIDSNSQQEYHLSRGC